MSEAISKERGFTLVEILVAVLLLGIGLLATAGLVASSESTSLDAELQQIATAEAENRVEEIVSLPWQEIGHADPPQDLEGTVSGSSFTPPGESSEELVIAANDEAGDSTGGVIHTGATGDLKQAKAIAIDTGETTLTGTAYTFVSWSDQECEAVDLTALQAGVTDLRNELQALSGELDGLRGEVDDLIGILLLPSSVRSIYESLIPGLIADLDASAAELDTLLATLGTAEIDLCDLPQEAIDAIDGLVDPDGVGGFEASAEVLGVTADLSAAADFDVPIAIPPVSCGLPHVQLFCDDSKDLETEIETGGIDATLTGIDADAQGLAAALTTDTTHNTKRVTVGIVIDTPGSDVTPQNPIWVSEIVSDPNEGLL